MRKVCSILLVCVVLLSSLVGCSLFSKDNYAPQISADDNWFSYHAFDMKSDYKDSIDPTNYYFAENWVLGTYNNEFIQLIDVSSDVQSEMVTLLEFYDENGNRTNAIDIASRIADYEEYSSVLNVSRNANKLSIFSYSNVYEYDLDANSFICISENIESPDLYTNEVNEHSIELNGTTVDFAFIFDSVNYYKIAINYSNDTTNYIDLRTALNGTPIQHIATVFPLDETNIGFVDIGNIVRYYRLNIESGEIDELAGDDVEFLSNYYFQSISYFNETNDVIGVNETGFYKIDFSNNNIEKVFDWNWCTFDRMLFLKPTIVEYTPDRIVVMDANSTSDDSYCLILNREDNNPNAGKYILTIDGTSLSSQVSKFNETDDTYFIEIDNRYSCEGLLDINFLDDIDTYYNDVLQQEQSLSTQMAIDIMSGDSPDLICDAYTSSQLLNSDLLYDISELIETDTDYDSTAYFQNVIDASRVNDKLLYMPLTFGVEGIGTIDSDYLDITGLTYDEYRVFVDDVCNGKDPIAYRRFQFVESLLPSTLVYCFGENGSIDFDNDAFRNLAIYANNDFIERSQEFDEDTFRTAASLSAYSIGDYLRYIAYENWNYNNVNLLPYPSYSGSGLSVSVNSSISISTNAKDKEGCYKFIKFLISQETMLDIGSPNSHNERGLTTINIDAFYDIQEMSLEIYNLECDYYNAMREESGMNIMGVPEIVADNDMIDYYCSIIESCEYVNYSDPTVDLIIYEETQAYFAGDKSLDEIIVIMNDRAQRAIDERG